MQSNKGQRCDLCGKEEAKTRDKVVSLKSICKHYAAFAMQKANYTMQDNCKRVRGDNDALR